ncbi:M48 family metallopeptidase [Natrinema salsiterrestre]|uniref:M48 family metallopeptidase n=1 Tax=Natrinema salsiterrestre TaxID=2950540 RepID=A0A9Q4L143_9EURY|nr:M48 family metallopeptidase [Natrinema salsiterrestre]MDF9745629.1 M48 family metallopeptidase [Natrinema salsiterrestre]
MGVTRVRAALWGRMALSVVLLALAMGLLVAVEVVLIGLASGMATIVPYGLFAIALGSSSLALLPTAAVYGGLAFTAWCAVRVMRTEPNPSETTEEVVAVTYLLVIVSSLVATGYLLVSVLGFPIRAAILVCGILVATAFVGWLLYAALDWSNRDEADRSEDRGVDTDDATDTAASDDPVGIATEMRRVFGAVGNLTARPAYGYLGVALAASAVVGSVYAAATALPSEYHLPGLAAVGSVCIVGLHVGSTIRSEFTGEPAVIRDLERTERDGSGVVPDERELTTLRATVGRLAAQTDVPSPAIRLTSSAAPRAVTAGYRPATSTIVVSRGLLETLDDRELEAVLAHELAHVANRDAAVMTFLAVPAASASATVDRHVANPVVTAAAAVTYAVSRWCVALVSSYREFVADDGAVAITGDPAALASALETLDRDLERRPATDLRDHRSAAAFSIVPPPWEEHRFFDRTRRVIARKLFGTHPETEKRIERLGAAVERS